MKVLFVSESPINKQVSIGNTFLDVFENVSDVELYSFYIRNGYPDASRIKEAYRITDKSLIKHCLCPSKMGNTVNMDNIPSHNTEFNKFEKYVKKNRPAIFFLLRTLAWKILPWKRSGLRDYIKKLNPDIIFTLLTNEILLNDIILYIKNNSDAKLVIYAWDDTYGMAAHSKNTFTSSVHKIRRKKMRKVVSQADKMYVISDMQKKEYEKDFNKNLNILTKSGEFSDDFSAEGHVFGKPLKMLYTGNLSLGRWKSVSAITESLKSINTDGKTAVLDIYSSTVLTQKQISEIADNDNSFFRGEISPEEVEKLQNEADILVFCEGFDEDYKKLVRLSFSTKLVDYFKKGKPIFALGPTGVSSVNYLTENDAAFVCTDIEKTAEKLKSFLNNEKLLYEYSLKSFECGKKNHNSLTMSEMLSNDLKDLINQERK